MSREERSALQIEAALRRHFARIDPGPAPLALSSAIDRIPTSVDRPRRDSLLRRLTPGLSLAAAAAVLGLLVRLLPSGGFGAGAGPAPTSIPFDPTLVGPGLGPPFDTGTPWLLVVLAAAILAVVAMGLPRRGRVLVGAMMAVLLGYALFGTFVPIDVRYTGWGPGMNVVGADMPIGASEQLYYEIAPPRQPFSFGLVLEGGATPPVRIEELVDDFGDQPDLPGLRWTAVWLDGEQHGGLTGPAQRFAPFTMNGDLRGIWLVGRAGSCAIGHAPNPSAPGTGRASAIESVRLNVTVYGWPRVIEVALPHLLEEAGDCLPSNASPAP